MAASVALGGGQNDGIAGYKRDIDVDIMRCLCHCFGVPSDPDSQLVEQLVIAGRYRVTALGPLALLAGGGSFPSWAELVVLPSAPDQPVISLRLELDNGQPVVASLFLSRTTTGRPVEAAVLKTLPITKIVDDAINVVAFAARSDEWDSALSIGDDVKRAEAVVEIAARGIDHPRRGPRRSSAPTAQRRMVSTGGRRRAQRHDRGARSGGCLPAPHRAQERGQVDRPRP